MPMTGERVREREPGREVEDILNQNITSFENEEDARNKIMDRFNAGESVIQPPESPDKSLGDSIREQLAGLR